MKHLFCFYILTLFASSTFAQTTMCGVTVDAGEDISLCEPGGIVNLDGEITGNILDFEWIGPVDNPYSLSTTANVSTTTDFILRARVKVNNLIANHDFEAGNVDFASEYTYVNPVPGALVPEGVYTVHDNPSTVHPNFPACSDHTTGNGLYMQINGNANSGVEVWCQDIATTPSLDYLFSAWTQSIIGDSPARLQFTINGNTLGNIYNLPPNTCQWTEFNASWNSGGNNTARICITNLNTATGGNDFGIDDIYFGTVCEIEDTVRVTILENVENDIDTVFCDGDEIIIDGQTITSSGQYGPFIYSAANGCDSLLTVNVETINLDPIITEPHYLTCDSTTVWLSADLSMYNFDPIEFVWSTTEGNIVSGQGTPFIHVDEPGIYYLHLIYDNGTIICESEEIFIEVYEDVDIPEADITVNQDDCKVEIWDLTAVTDIGNADFFWSTDDGVLIPPYNQNSIQAFQEGTYYLEVTNTFNGCSMMDTVTVTLNSINFEIIGDDTLDCTRDTLLLYGNNPSLDYIWTTDTGTIVGNPNSDSIRVISGGRYILIGSEGDCEGSDTIEIVNQIEVPVITLGPDLTLDCNTDSLSIDAIVTAREDYEITWSSDGGSIIGDINGTSIGLKSPGIYIAEVVTSGGCIARDSVIVTEEGDKPRINISRVDTLTCNNLTAIIDARTSDIGADYSFSWTVGNNGNIISSIDSLLIIVDAIGTYELEITNTTNGCSSSTIIEVFSTTDMPIVDAGPDSTLLCGQNTLQLQGSITNPETTDSIFWTTTGGMIDSNNGSLTPIISSTGLYILHVKNIKTGCIGIDTVEVFKDDSSPQIQLIDRDTLNCLITSLELSALGSDMGIEYAPLWSTIDGNIITAPDSYEITIDAPGTYTFTLINTDNNCVSTHTVEIISLTDAPEFMLLHTGNINCLRIQDTISVSTQLQNYTANWTAVNGGNIVLTIGNDRAIVDRAGTYRVTITDPENGCSTTEVIIVEEFIETPEITSQDDSITCDREIITLSPTISSLEAYTTSWTTIGGNITTSPTENDITINQSGLYIIEVTSEISRCVSIDTVEITDVRKLPLLIAGPDRQLTCDTVSVQLELASWDPTESINRWYNISGTLYGQNTSSIQVSSPGTFIIEATNQANFCTTRDTIIVTENVTLPSVSIDSDGTYLGCGTDELSLSARTDISNAVFMWTNSSRSRIISTQIVSIDSADTYKLTITNPENGCKDSSSIEVTEIDDINYEIMLDDASCLKAEGSITFLNVNGGDGNYIYYIENTPYQNSGPHLVDPGNYTVRIEDNFGCVTEDVVTINEPVDFTINYISEHEINLGDSVILSWIDTLQEDRYSFRWTPSTSIDCDTCATPTARPEKTTNYKLDVQDERGCTASAQVIVYVKNEIKYYIPTAFSPNQDGINDIFRPYIGSGIEHIESMRIYDRWGSMIYHTTEIDKDDPTDGWNGMSKGQLCDPGVFAYSIKLKTIQGEMIHLNGGFSLLR